MGTPTHTQTYTPTADDGDMRMFDFISIRLCSFLVVFSSSYCLCRLTQRDEPNVLYSHTLAHMLTHTKILMSVGFFWSSDQVVDYVGQRQNRKGEKSCAMYPQ